MARINVLNQFMASLSRIQDWTTYFWSLEQRSPRGMGCKEGMKHMDLNRYIDIIPLDHSRIILRSGSETGYINANTLAPYPYILSQGPLFHTVQDHWQMIAQEKVSIIVMLCSSHECSPYWPSTLSDVLVCPNYDLEIFYQSSDENPHFTIRTFLLKDLAGQTQRTIKHFNFTNWPDYGTPRRLEPFLAFVKEIQRYEDHLGAGPQTPNKLVHCLAGIGRSGSYTLVDYALRKFRNTGYLSFGEVEETLLQMRRSRSGLIQTDSQLQFSFYAICRGLAENNGSYVSDAM